MKAINNVFDILPKEEVGEFREQYKGKSYDLVQDLFFTLNSMGMKAAYVAFSGKAAPKIKVSNELEDSTSEYECHAIIIVGIKVIDLLHSNNAIDLKYYIDELSRLNVGGVKVRADMSFLVDTDTGYQTTVNTISDLEKYYDDMLIQSIQSDDFEW